MNVHVYPSTIEHESRIKKITGSLVRNDIFDSVEIVGKWREGLPDSEQVNKTIRIKRIRPTEFTFGPASLQKLLTWMTWYLKTVIYLIRKSKIICINPHSVTTLPLGVLCKISKGSLLVYDTHELETEVTSAIGLKKIIYKTIEKALIRFVDMVFVVNGSIREWYQKTYPGISVFVVRNIPDVSQELPPDTDYLREKFLIPKESLVLIYQGLLTSGRGIDILLKTVPDIKHVHLVLMGYGNLFEDIKELVSRQGNIHYHSAVEPSEMPLITGSADIGVCLLENAGLSYYLSLPNKLFEYFLSGIPVLGSNFPEIRNAINSYQMGWATDPDCRSLKTFLEGLTKEMLEEKKKLIRENIELPSWSQEETTLIEAYQTILRPNWVNHQEKPPL